MIIKNNCAFDKLVPISNLVPNPRNPNKHSEDQINLLAKVIIYQGWRNPIVVSNRSGFIVKGHARLQAGKLLGVSEIPVDFQDYDSEAMEWADLIADNRISELAEWDTPKLKDLLADLDIGELDLDLTGFDEKALEKLMVLNDLIPRDNAEIPALDTDTIFYAKIEDMEEYAHIKSLLGKYLKGNEIEAGFFYEMVKFSTKG